MTKLDVDKIALSEVFGEHGTKIIHLIDTPMEDKEISAKLDTDTSSVRTFLNELLANNLVNLYRVRHDTGYTNYSWVRRADKIAEYVNQVMEKKIRKLDRQLNSPEEIVFECGCARVDYGSAIEYGFYCSDCGKSFKETNPMKGSRKIKAEMKRLEGLISAS